MGKTLLITALLTLSLTGCAHKPTNNVPPPIPQHASAAQQPTPEMSVVVKEGGWQVPCLKGSKAGEHIEVKNTEAAAPKMYFTNYRPGAPARRQCMIPQSFFSEDERQRLRVFRFDLAAADLWGYDVGGRKYCYVLRTQPTGIGASQTLRFCDMDGDGTFESAETGFRGFAPELPGWAHSAANVE